jgi:poly-gamma-glutamate synthesis protein (capsule biosynthesis protein)
VRRKFEDADIFVANLEGPVFQGETTRPEGATVLSNHEFSLQLFMGTPIGVLNLGNNHVMDFGEKGLRRTLSLATQNGLKAVGAGFNENDANNEVVLEHKGRRIAFLSYTSDEVHVGATIADSKSAGCASFRDEQAVLDRIKRIRKHADIICISLHWGYEYYSYPSPGQVRLAHQLVDAGATLVVGHHPHVLQGVEEYENAVILYSLGNLFFPPVRSSSGRVKRVKKISREFMLARVNIDGDAAVDLRLSGGQQDETFHLSMYEGTIAEGFKRRIDVLSKPIGKPGYEDFWKTYREKREKELKREGVLEALEKAKRMSMRELVRSVSMADLRRNVRRLKDGIFS